MSVTIVVQRRARPGEDTARVAATLRRVEEHGRPRQDRQPGRLFRRLDDPQVLWYVGQWDSRAAYTGRPRAPSADALDALCVGEPVRYYFAQYWLSWNMSRRTIMWDGTLVQAPLGMGPSMQPVLRQEAGEKPKTSSGLVECCLYQDLDDADRFLILRGWQSPTAWETFEREGRLALDTALRRFGASAAHVVELVLLEYDRLVTAGL